MGYNNFTAQETAAIFDMMTCLEELNIRYNKLGDHEAELLSEGITNTKTLRVLYISHNDIASSGTIAIANSLSYNNSLEEIYMCDDNFIGQAAAKALGNAIINNTKLKILKLWDKHGGDVYPIDTESAMIIIRSLCNNNTITELGLHIALYKNYINLVTREAEFVNSIRESKDEHIIDFTLFLYDLQGKQYGKYTTEEKLLWWPATAVLTAS